MNFPGNLYGTAISAVRVAREKGTPLLTPHPLALRHLRTPEFAPIIIFVQPPGFHDFKVGLIFSFQNTKMRKIVFSATAYPFQ